MRYLSLVIIALLLTGILATTLTSAQTEEEVSSADEVSDSIGIKQDTQESLDESEAVPDSDVKVVGLRTITLAEGWVISKDGSKAEIAKGLWVSGRELKVDAAKVKETREKYAGEKEKIKEELSKLTSDVVYFANGRLNMGLGKNMEKFKLVKKFITNESVSFYVLAISEKKNVEGEEAARLAVGSLELVRKKYPDLAIWTGSLSLTSGKYIGNWNVNLASKNFAYKKAVEAETGEGKKLGFWQRLFGWGKAKEDKEDKAKDKPVK